MVFTEQPFKVFCNNVSDASINERLVSLFLVVSIYFDVISAPATFHDGNEAE